MTSDIDQYVRINSKEEWHNFVGDTKAECLPIFPFLVKRVPYGDSFRYIVVTKDYGQEIVDRLK